MADKTSLSQAYFKGLRLGDFLAKRPELRLNHTPPDFAASVSSKYASARASGPNGWYQITVVVGFRRGFRGNTESPAQLWDRIQTFLTELLENIAPKQGHGQPGPLSIVRDRAGEFDAQDSVLTTTTVSVAEPSQFTLAEDVEAIGWEVGQRVLMLDPGNASTFDYEVGQIDSLQGSGIAVDSVGFTKPIGTEVCRLERLFPEVTLMESVATPVGGKLDKNVVREVRLSFGGTMDPIAGDLA